ncbi:MAG: hypothetical protein HYZ50_12660 [Deltaproteobacteria bacterium]|nr:hypothetical protein [Deltaproteobacteria bacterium]
MLWSWFLHGSLVTLLVLKSASVQADAFVNFLAKQKIGQDMTVTGGFKRFSGTRHFFQRDDKTGEVQDFDYYGMVFLPTTLIGDGTLSLKASPSNSMLLLHVDPDLVKDLPEQGEDFWFTGTLIGFQHGVSGITSSVFSGGFPYLLLKRVSTAAPPEFPPSPPAAQEVPSSAP